MARFDKSSTKRPKQNAAVAATRGPKRSTAPSIEDTMFFPRLRRHAKWMFVFLAVALGGGFVIFGVGAGGTGVGDILRGGGGNTSGIPSVVERDEEDGGEPEGRAGLARPLDGAADERRDRRGDHGPAARRAPRAQMKHRRRSPSRPRPLCRAAGRRAAAELLQVATAYTGGASQTFPGMLTSPSSQSILDNRIGASVNNQAATEVQKLIGEAQTATVQAVDSYKKMAKLQPNDPNLQLELAQAAQQAGDTPTAIAAYTKFLKLAPDDPSAAIVKAQLKQLKQSSSTSG